MSLPNNSLSSLKKPEPFVEGAQFPILLDKDIERGGIAIQDSSQGLDVKFWYAEIINNSDIIIYADDVEPITFYSGNNITEVSLAFDQVMRPTVAFVEDGMAKLRWYDSQAGETVTTEYSSDYVSPKVTLDLNKQSQVGESDIIFAYVRDNKLYYRDQGDRYGVEYLLSERPLRRLQKIGFTAGSRMQFMGI